MQEYVDVHGVDLTDVDAVAVVSWLQGKYAMYQRKPKQTLKYAIDKSTILLASILCSVAALFPSKGAETPSD